MARTQRIGISFDEAQANRFLALAEYDRKKPATLASEIISDYMKNRSGDIDSVLRIKADYQKNLNEIRNQ